MPLDADERAERGDSPGRDLDPVEEALDGEVESEKGSDERRLIAARQEFSGPLPAPGVLGAYDEVKPGLANVIVEQWQLETQHRHKTIDSLRETDHEAMRLFYAGEKRGQFIGLAAFLGIVGVAVIALLKGSDATAIGGLIVAASYAVWALRRSSSAAMPPTDLADGDELETRPKGAGEDERS